MENFELLPYNLARNAFFYGYKAPTRVQKAAIPLLQRHKSVIVQSPTGSGKTAAFVLGAYLAVHTQSPVLYVIVVSPTRELCRQTSVVFYNLTDLRVMAVITQIDYFNYFKGTYYVVVTTLERFQKLFQPKTVKVVIFDEVDYLLSEKLVLMQAAALSCQEKQCVLCSATFSADNLELTKRMFKIDEEIRAGPERGIVSNKHYLHICSLEDRAPVLLSVLQTFIFNYGVIFCNYRHTVDAAVQYLRGYKCDAKALHSGVANSDRVYLMRRFCCGEFRVLVCTDLFGRGMDVRYINLVVNYDLPSDCETFEHRSGRGGRFGRSGNVVTIADDSYAELVQYWWKALRYDGEMI